MITTLIAMSLMSFTQQNMTMNCPVSGEDIDKPFATILYKGAAFGICCPMCEKTFMTEPDKYLKPDAVKKKNAGVALFNPITHIRIKPDKDSVGPVLYNGVSYFFNTAEEQKAFESDMKKYTDVPAKEALYCPVMKHEVKDIRASGGYADIDGVRYYICCSPCAAKLAAEPSKYLDETSAKYVHDVVAVKAEKTDK